MKLSVIVLVIFGLTYEVSSDEKITEKKGSEYIRSFTKFVITMACGLKFYYRVSHCKVNKVIRLC